PWADHTVTGSDGNPTKTLPATTTSFNLPNRDAGTPYEAQVRALTSKEGPGPWSDIGEGRVNRPPNGTSLGIANGSFTVSLFVKSSSPAADYFSDADGDTLTYSTSSNYRGVAYSYVGIDPDVEGNPVKFWARAINPSTATITYGASDAYGGYVSKSWNITGVANPTRDVPENSPAGTAVGAPVVGSSWEGRPVTYTYTLTGEAADFFDINSATGQISVKQGTTLDYETKTSYTGQVHWTVQEQPAVANLTINVVDLEAGKPDAPTVTRTEFAEQSNPALDVTWTKPADNGLTISWYQVQYRKQGVDSWTPYSGHVIETTSLRLSNLEAGAVYEFQVRAGTNEEGLGPWSDTGSARANRPPQYAVHNGEVIFLVNGPGWPVGETYLGNRIAVHYVDPDGDPLSWDVSSQYPGIGDVAAYPLDELGAQRWTFNFYNPATLELTYGVHDGYGGYIDRKFSWTGTQAETRDIAENSAAGTAVGDPVTGTPYDDGDDQTDDALSYRLSGEVVASDLFVIDAATGQISLAEDANLDYETKTSYTGKVHWTVQGQAAAANLTINVTDVEAGKPDAPTLTRTEFSQQSNPALDVTWTAPAANGLTITGYNAQYRKKVADGETANAWTDYTVADANEQQTSELPATTTSINLPGLDAGATYEVQVRAVTSEEGEGPWSDIGEGTANRPPTAGASPLADATAAWNESTDYDVSDKFSDADGDTLTYSASSEYPGVLTAAITGDDADTLTVTVINPAASTVTYGVSDGYGGYASLTVEITGARSETRSVIENAAAGTAVGDPVTGTPYDDGDDQTNDALSYSLSGEASTSGAFVIDSATGQISVKQGASFDRATKSSYTGKVHWTVQGQAAVTNLTIDVTETNAVIASAPTLTRTRFSEPSNPALDATWAAAEANGTTVTGYEAQYRKQVAAGEEANEWTAYTGTLSATATSLNLPNLEAGATYEVQVRAVSSEEGVGPWSDTGSGQANRPPTASALSLSDATIAWKGSADYDVSDKFEDADGDTLTYSASAAHPGVLTTAITGNDSDTLRVAVLNPASSTVTYAASDAYGGYIARTVTITGEGSATRSIAENSAAGTAAGDPVTGTPHGTATLSYTLTGEAATSGAFVIDSATGQISVKQGATIDYEAKTSYSGTVGWTVQGQAASTSLTVNVTNVTGPEKPAAPSAEAGADAPASSLDVSWTAPEDLGSAISGYRVRYRKAGPTEWTDHTFSGTGTETTIGSLDAATIYKVQVLAINAEGESDWSASGTGVTGPVQQTAERSVPEDAEPGAAVGEPVTATNPGGHTLSYGVVTEVTGASGDGANAQQQTSPFVIDAATGQIRVAPGASLDYETANSHELKVRATHTVSELPGGQLVNAVIT
ncbi:MAG: hypothetical protein F4Z25_04055, partial [Chloroflexi bacterium]|nr:hypothetical protein [Chloroflexota bacterium]